MVTSGGSVKAIRSTATASIILFLFLRFQAMRFRLQHLETVFGVIHNLLTFDRVDKKNHIEHLFTKFLFYMTFIGWVIIYTYLTNLRTVHYICSVLRI